MWRFVSFFLLLGVSKACVERKFPYGKVCVCNSTYCDTVQLGTISNGKIKVFMTSQVKPGFNVREENFSGTKNSTVSQITVTPNIKFQKILGFGGAFTDSVGHNIKLLPAPAQRKLLESYFSDDGIEYSMGRVPVGGADFSPSFYTLDDHDGDDFELKHFALHQEDLNHKIPFIKTAFDLRKNKPLRLFASAWTIPAWMRHSPGYTVVKKTHYQVYADYYIKYFQEMLKHGVKFYGMTTQNGATNGLLPGYIPGVFWIPDQLNKWLKDYLVPTLKNSSLNIKIILHDDNWPTLPFIANPIINDEKTVQYIEAVATHWYSFGSLPLEVLNLARSKSKEIMLMNSEACYLVSKPYLGHWGRATDYVGSVLEHLKSGFNAWNDWNLVMNITGGPNSAGFSADAPIVIAANHKQFFKQPLFYAYGVITKFLPPDSVSVGVSVNNNPKDDLQVFAAVRPDNLTSVIVHNQNLYNASQVQVIDSGRVSAVMEIPAASIQTFVY